MTCVYTLYTLPCVSMGIYFPALPPPPPESRDQCSERHVGSAKSCSSRLRVCSPRFGFGFSLRLRAEDARSAKMSDSAAYGALG